MDKETPVIKRVSEIEHKGRFWYQWIVKYSLGELLGIGAAAVTCRLLLFEVSDVIAQSPSYVTPLVLAISGLAEGWIIGYLQWKSLSKLVADLGKVVWVVVSIVSMIIGWLLIIPPAIFFISIFIDFSLEREFYTFLSTAVMGLSFGGIVGMGQYFVLRKFYKNSLIWILANAIGWMLSFLLVYLSLAVMKQTHSILMNILLIIIACILSGMVQGIVSGLALRSIMSIKRSA